MIINRCASASSSLFPLPRALIATINGFTQNELPALM
jgi:hypothetical protein